MKPVIPNSNQINRRAFLRLAALGLGGLALRPIERNFSLPEFPLAERLGRAFTKVEVKKRPDFDSETVDVLFDDTVVPWLKEVAGPHTGRYRLRWVETPTGYIWASELQPVRNIPNQPLTSLPETTLGQGIWAEVSVPYVDIALEREPVGPGMKYLKENGYPIRLYYSQVVWVDQIKTDATGQVRYRVNERYGYGDLMWGAAEAFRPLTSEEIAPISPNVEDKQVVINVNEKYQTLSCFEGKSEVYFCRIAGGKRYDAEGTPLEHSSTPSGTHIIWRKQVSSHMSGGTTGAGYDLPGIGWTTLFSGDGVAIHSTFWHNNFGGELMSHGCVNAAPDDAKWVFRWTNPPVAYDPGDLYSKDTTIAPTRVKVLDE
jgi:lipoprotein-anchoring transpeptidase ErfK/SrfK